MMPVYADGWCQTCLRHAKQLVATVLFMMCFSIPVAHAANAARGAIIVQVRCSACHFINRPEHKLGPSLFGIYDRAPSISGVPFKHWNAKALNEWLSGPRKIKINTTMVLPPLMAQDRADIIAFFKLQKQKLTAASQAVP